MSEPTPKEPLERIASALEELVAVLKSNERQRFAEKMIWYTQMAGLCVELQGILKKYISDREAGR